VDEKAPAFQFYPRDWDTDERVIPMTYEEEGVYWALCRRYWLAGNTLPADLNELRALLKGRPSLVRMQRWWVTIGQCFQVVEGRLKQKRLDRERAKQIENRAKRQKAAEERWERERQKQAGHDASASPVHMQSRPPDDALQCLASASASAIATAVENPSTPSPQKPGTSRSLSLIQPRDKSAFSEGPVFNIPQKWATKVLAAANGSLSEPELDAFCSALHVKVERDRIDVAAQPNFLGWLDGELREWRRGQSQARSERALELQGQRHLAKVAAMERGE
jgi:uncharacterized protein YdaU (DUF1376 family)